MFSSYHKQNSTLEKFRIKAHLRSYIKDPIIIDGQLLKEATEQLKKLPYNDTDPAGPVAIELVLKAYRLGYFLDQDLTDAGLKIADYDTYQPAHELTTKRNYKGQRLGSFTF